MGATASLEDRARVVGLQPEATYLTPHQAAVMSGFTYKALEAMRGRGEGPPYLRVCHRIRYPRAALIAWMDAHPTGGAA